jgi:hypothetical protein
VHGRVLLGVAAWLAGATAATGGSLLAVSVLGQGMTPGSGAQRSVTTVNRALAREAAERATAMPGRAAAPRRAVPPKAARIALPSPVARHRAASPAVRNSAAPPSPGAPGGTVLTSQGGTVVASCAGAAAYLVSWSPQQGFGATGVVRGPATNARVTFTGGQLTVTMVVSCDAGAPTATATAVSISSSATSGPAGDGE